MIEHARYFLTSGRSFWNDVRGKELHHHIQEVVVEISSFESHPNHYKHWKLDVSGEVATLTMDIQEEDEGTRDYLLKLNSYDIFVDIELNDAVGRLRFEHPEVKVVVVTSGKDRIFCAGANIPMLSSSTHAFKVNFCRFTNETRLAIEDASTCLLYTSPSPRD